MLTLFAVATNLRLLRGWARRNRSGDELIHMLIETHSADAQQPVDAPANSGNDPPAHSSHHLAWAGSRLA